jgi:signal transduction histidine kinase
MRPIILSPNTIKKIAIHKYIIRAPLGKILSVLSDIMNSALTYIESGRVIDKAAL